MADVSTVVIPGLSACEQCGPVERINGHEELNSHLLTDLMVEIHRLRTERDCLRSALIDAGYSLKADRIARYADGVE